MPRLSPADLLKNQDVGHGNLGLATAPLIKGVSGAINACCRSASVQVGCRSNASRLHCRFKSDRERFALLDGGAAVSAHAAALNLGQT
jgi:hypothetical protein